MGLVKLNNFHHDNTRGGGARSGVDSNTPTPKGPASSTDGVARGNIAGIEVAGATILGLTAGIKALFD